MWPLQSPLAKFLLGYSRGKTCHILFTSSRHDAGGDVT